MIMATTTWQVVPGDKKWAVRRAGGRGSIIEAPSQAAAIDVALALARREQAEVVVHGRSGKVVRRLAPESETAEREPAAMRTFTAIVYRDGRWFVAECPEVGTVSQGRTRDSAVRNLREATVLYLAEFPLPDIGRPFVTTFDVSDA